MSNLTIGKIVNNSVTLVLHTADITAATMVQADRAIVPATHALGATESHADREPRREPRRQYGFYAQDTVPVSRRERQWHG